MSAWQPCGKRIRECIDDACRSMGECAWPPPPPGALGWNVYGGPIAGEYTWHEFVPASDLDEKLEAVADQLAAEIEEVHRGPR